MKHYANCEKLTKNKKFCSRACSVTVANKIPKRKKKEQIKIQKIEPIFEERGHRSQKRFLLKERGHKCEGRCGLSEWFGEKIPLQLDHIDGDTGNKKKENLRLLCGNCHMLTPTYAGKNVGKAKNINRKNSRAKYYKYVNE